MIPKRRINGASRVPGFVHRFLDNWSAITLTTPERAGHMEDRSQLGNNSGSVKSTGQVLVNGQTGSYLPDATANSA